MMTEKEKEVVRAIEDAIKGGSWLPSDIHNRVGAAFSLRIARLRQKRSGNATKAPLKLAWDFPIYVESVGEEKNGKRRTLTDFSSSNVLRVTLIGSELIGEIVYTGRKKSAQGKPVEEQVHLHEVRHAYPVHHIALNATQKKIRARLSFAGGYILRELIFRDDDNDDDATDGTEATDVTEATEAIEDILQEIPEELPDRLVDIFEKISSVDLPFIEEIPWLGEGVKIVKVIGLTVSSVSAVPVERHERVKLECEDGKVLVVHMQEVAWHLMEGILERSGRS